MQNCHNVKQCKPNERHLQRSHKLSLCLFCATNLTNEGGTLCLPHLPCYTFSHCCDNENLLMRLGCRCCLAFVSQKEQLKTCQRHYFPCRFVLLSSILANVFVHLIFLYHSLFHPEGILRERMLHQGKRGQTGQNETNFITCRGRCGSCSKGSSHHWLSSKMQNHKPLLLEPVFTPYIDGALCHLRAVPWLPDMLLWPWRIRPHKTGVLYT